MTLLMREVVAITAAVDLGVAYIGVAPLREPTERSIANDRHPDAPAMRSHFSGDGRACRDISAPVNPPAGRSYLTVAPARSGLARGPAISDQFSSPRSRHLAIR